jgi:hypothetical protein
MVACSRKDKLSACLFLGIILIGTATGSAMAMIFISATMLALMVVFHRKEFRGKEYRNGVLLTIFVSAIISISIVISFFLVQR